MSDQGPSTPSEVDEEIKRLYGQIFDMNTELFGVTRHQIEAVTVIRDAFLIQADVCTQIIQMYAKGAQLAAATSGDLLLNLHGMEAIPVEDDEDEDDEDV